jgi:hypothetical protein
MLTITSAMSWRTCLAFGVLTLLLGCAQTSVKVAAVSSADDFPNEELRSSFGNIAIIPLYEPPNIALNATVYKKGKCAIRGAGSGIEAALSGGGDAAVIGIVLAPIFAVVGAIAGAVEADSEKKVISRIEVIQSKTASSDIAYRFQERASELARQYNGYTLLADPTDQSTDYQEIPFDLLREHQIDTVVQLGITNIATRTAEAKYCDPKLELRIQTSLALFDAADERQIFSTSIHRKTEARKLEDWAKKDARHWNVALHKSIDKVTMGLLDDVFLYIAPPAQILPVRPPSHAETIYERRIGLRPALAWAWNPKDKSSWTGATALSNADITYDLRIINTRTNRVIYEKFGLSHAQHKVEKKLPKKFYWQVRANYSWDGLHRRTRWLGKFLAKTWPKS